MRGYWLICSAVALSACASVPQRETRSRAEHGYAQLAVNEAPEYEYREEWVLLPSQHWEQWIVGPTNQWPLDDVRRGWPSDEGWEMLRSRWEQGTTAAVRKRDTVAIRLVVFEHMPRRDRRLHSIRQISQQEVMVEASYHHPEFTGAGGTFWFVVVRSGYGWKLIAQYPRALWTTPEPPNNRVQQTVRPVTAVAVQRPRQAVPQLTLEC
jgi:hypothetical protein